MHPHCYRSTVVTSMYNTANGVIRFYHQMNFKGLKNLDIDASMNARGVVSYLKAKLTKVGGWWKRNASTAWPSISLLHVSFLSIPVCKH